MIDVGGILPSVSLPEAGTSAVIALRGARGPQVLVAVHSICCEACMRYVRALAAGAVPITEWGARIVVAAPDAPTAATGLGNGRIGSLRVVRDSDGVVASGRAVVVIADEWGEVFAVMDAAEGHRLPSLDEIGEWVRFLAIQCPECEGPEGKWRTL